MTETDAVDVLLLEDNHDEAAFIERIVRGYATAEWDVGEDAIDIGELHHVDSLDDALAFLRTTDVDVVLSDLMLPDSRGVDTIESLVTHAPELPVVALTGHDERLSGTRAIEAGAQDYLVKGRLSGELVNRAIRYAIERKRHELDLVEANHRLALLNRIIGQDIQREMSVVVGWAAELGDAGDAPNEALDALLEGLENVVDLADTAADVVTVLEREPGGSPEPCALVPILSAEVERLTRDRPDVAFEVIDETPPDEVVTVLATPMLGSAFEQLFAEAIRDDGEEPPRPRVTVDAGDERVTVTLQGEGVGLSEEQEAFLNASEALSGSYRRMRTGLYLARTVIEHLGGEIGVRPGPEIAITIARAGSTE